MVTSRAPHAPLPLANRSDSRRISRRACLVALAAFVSGCHRRGNTMGWFDRRWGRRGISEGRFQKPRAMAIDDLDRIYVVDMTARIQVFDTDGRFLRGWKTPEKKYGKPTGLSVGIDGRILVADTHYHRVLIYSPDGELTDQIGGTAGEGPGQFDLVRDAVQDSKGCYYVAESGEWDRIQKFTSTGEFLRQWGGNGTQPGQLALPQSMAVDQHDQIWVADAANHRIQVFDGEGNVVTVWGTKGAEPGKLRYPYDLVLLPDGSVCVAEFGNHRIQRFTRDGRSTGCWGSHGRDDGQLAYPWGLVRDSRGTIHVLDTGNHRVQRVKI
jgi:DNA-binding beta-propeller fold protein YncE